MLVGVIICIVIVAAILIYIRGLTRSSMTFISRALDAEYFFRVAYGVMTSVNEDLLEPLESLTIGNVETTFPVVLKRFKGGLYSVYLVPGCTALDLTAAVQGIINDAISYHDNHLDATTKENAVIKEYAEKMQQNFHKLRQVAWKNGIPIPDYK